MAIRKYTRDQLLVLRSSPLVQKPDNLPAIEQWIEYVYVYNGEAREKLRIPHSEPSQQQHQQAHQHQQNAAGARRQPQQAKVVGGDASPMGSFSAGVRPGLVTRTTGSKSGEDISLGPPRTMFPSSRNTARLADFGDKTASTPGDATPGEDYETPRSKFFGERASRKSVNEKESWTTVRERRVLGVDDESKHESRPNRRERDHDRDHRNGHGEKHDGRWSERRQNGDRPGGWRERQREKERDGDRSGPLEKEPEWMDDPAPPHAEDDLRSMGVARNQEQFQKWKEAMSGKKAQTEEAEPTQVEESAPTQGVAASKPVAPLKLEGIVDRPFGGWADNKSSGGTFDNSSTSVKVAPTKGKASRFASMFKESQPKEDVAQSEPPVPSSTGGAGANGSAEDEVGFKRILQMLGGTGIGQPAVPEMPTSPPARATSNGAKQKSRFTGFFDQTPKSPEIPQSPRETAFLSNNGDIFQTGRGMTEESNNMFGGILPDLQGGENLSRKQMPSEMRSPEPSMDGTRAQQAPPGRVNDIFLDQQQPPSRGAATPDVNIQNLLASQRAQKSQGQDKNSQFLLNLLQEKGSRQMSQQQRADGFPLWLEQPPNMPQEPHAPKPRGAPPPPGFIDDQLLRNAPPDPPRQDIQPMSERRPSQRAPPGFFDEQNLFLQQQQQQRRNYTEPPPQHQQPGIGRRMNGHPANLPQMQIPTQPPHQQFAGGGPLDFPQSPQGPLGPGQGPPPGFNPGMPRHPPGFHNFPNVFQQPQQQPQRNDMPGGGFPGGGMPGGAGGMASPTNAPPGFFAGPQGMPPPPPGFMGMRNPNDTIPAGMRDGGRGFDGGRFDGSIPRR